MASLVVIDNDGNDQMIKRNHLWRGDGSIKAKEQGNYKIHDGATSLYFDDSRLAKLRKCVNAGYKLFLLGPLG